jgi:hypothetical protein
MIIIEAVTYPRVPIAFEITMKTKKNYDKRVFTRLCRQNSPFFSFAFHIREASSCRCLLPPRNYRVCTRSTISTSRSGTKFLLPLFHPLQIIRDFLSREIGALLYAQSWHYGAGQLLIIPLVVHSLWSLLTSIISATAQEFSWVLC